MPRHLLSTLCTTLALLGALAHPAVADDPDAPSLASPAAPAAPSLAPPGMQAPEPARPHWNAPVPDAAEPEESRWYGKQIFLVDAIGAGVFFYALVHEDENAGWIGGLTLLLGAPIVHGANGELGNLLLSLPVRVAVPFAGALLGNEHLDTSSDVGGLLTGLALGVTATSIFDAMVLGRTRPGARPSSPAVRPQIGVTGNGFSAGIGGMF